MRSAILRYAAEIDFSGAALADLPGMTGGDGPATLVSYHYLVRATAIGALLNGRRYPRGLPAAC